MKKKFELGATVMTRGIATLMEDHDDFATFVMESLARHAKGDWGDLCDEDKALNEFGLTHNERLFSSYEKGNRKIWIITERDRSVTTVLLPEEY